MCRLYTYSDIFQYYPTPIGSPMCARFQGAGLRPFMSVFPQIFQPRHWDQRWVLFARAVM